MLPGELEAQLGSGTVFLDATDAISLRTILHSLGRSEALLLVLTESVLYRPWVLLEVYEAIRLKLPIMCVNVAGGGYRFDGVSSYLANLESELGTPSKR